MDEEQEPTKEAARNSFLRLPALIVSNIPEEKLALIRQTMSEMMEQWKHENASPDEDGYIKVPMGIDLYHWNNPQKIEFDSCPPWRIGITDGLTSPMGLLADLYFDKGEIIDRKMKLLIFYEYFAVVINDYSSDAPLDEIARYHAWMADSIVGWLIQLRGELGWNGVEPVSSIYQSCRDDEQKKEFAKLREIRQKQTEDFINKKVTDEDIKWIKSEGQRMKMEKPSLKHWGIAGILAKKLEKISQKQVSNYLKEAGL